MFYCNPCGTERGWPINTPVQSHGRCELCGKGASCNDVPSKHLPVPESEPDSTPDLRAGDPASWIACVWEGLEAYREDLIPEGDEHYDAIWSDLTTAMAWITEALGLPTGAAAEGEEAYFAEIVDEDGGRHWSDLIFNAADAEDALSSAASFADAEGERYGGDRALQVRGPFIIPAIPECGMIGDDPCTNHTDTGRGVCADCQQPIEGSRYA